MSPANESDDFLSFDREMTEQEERQRQLNDSLNQTDPISETNVTITQEMLDKFYKNINKLVAVSMGQGDPSNYLQTAMSKLDRFGTMMIPLNHEISGMTFITRPRLNFSSSSLRMHPILSTLDTWMPESVAFMIRSLLDTRISHPHSRIVFPATEEELKFQAIVDRSPLLNFRSPWLTPLCNCVTDISGFPDFNLETETTQGGFHSEDMTYAKGSDFLNRSTELSVGFRDIQGGIVMAIIYYWTLYMALQCKGEVMAYPDDIYEQRLNYDVAIYRFMFDPSREVITKWAKATGCYPKSVPIGSAFNINQGEIYVSSTAKFTVPFVVNKVEYMDPSILKDFNALARRYWPEISNAKYTSANTTDDNFLGLPFVVATDRGLEMRFAYDEGDKQVHTDALSELFKDAGVGYDQSGQLVRTTEQSGEAKPYQFIHDWRL